MTIKKYYIKFGGTEYNLHSFEHMSKTSTTIDTTELAFARSNDAIFDIGDDVSIGYHDENDNFVVDFNGDVTAKQVNEELIMTVESYSGRVYRTEYITEVHENKTIEWIVEWLVTTYTGLTYASTGATGITMERFVINEETVGDVLTRLYKNLDWQFRVDSNKNFYFEPSGNTPSAVILNNNTNAWLIGDWVKTPNRLTNTCTVIGDKAKFNTNETFVASAAQIEFIVTYKITGNVRVTVDGTEKVGGQDGSVSTFDYSVDNENKKITFESGMIGAESVIIYYEYELPIKITAKNESSLNTYGTFPRKVTDNTIKTTSDARKLAKKIVSLYGSPITSGKLSVGWDLNINTGETTTVTDTFNNVNSDFVVVSVSRSYPAGTRIVEVGIEDVNVLDLSLDINDRVKRLETKQDNTDVVQRYISFSENISVKLTSGRKRVRVRSIAGDSLIWGNTSFGVWGTGEWNNSVFASSFILGNVTAAVLGTSLLGSQAAEYSVVSVTNTNKIMNERFQFETYNDTTVTDATWDTIGGTTTYTSGQLSQSLSVAYADGTITKATLTPTEVSGSFTYAMTADGTNWETVVSGVEFTFANSGTDLRWRATENATSTGEINNIKIVYS